MPTLEDLIIDSVPKGNTAAPAQDSGREGGLTTSAFNREARFEFDDLEKDPDLTKSIAEASRHVYEVYMAEPAPEDWSELEMAEWGMKHLRSYETKYAGWGTFAFWNWGDGDGDLEWSDWIRGGSLGTDMRLKQATDEQQEAFRFLQEAYEKYDDNNLAYIASTFVSPETLVTIPLGGAVGAASKLIKWAPKAARWAPQAFKWGTAGAETVAFAVVDDRRRHSVNLTTGRADGGYTLTQGAMAAGMGLAFMGGFSGAGKASRWLGGTKLGQGIRSTASATWQHGIRTPLNAVFDASAALLVDAPRMAARDPSPGMGFGNVFKNLGESFKNRRAARKAATEAAEETAEKAKKGAAKNADNPDPSDASSTRTLGGPAGLSGPPVRRTSFQKKHPAVWVATWPIHAPVKLAATTLFKWFPNFSTKFINPWFDYQHHGKWDVLSMKAMRSNTIEKHAIDLDHRVATKGLNYEPSQSSGARQGLDKLKDSVGTLTKQGEGQIDDFAKSLSQSRSEVTAIRTELKQAQHTVEAKKAIDRAARDTHDVALTVIGHENYDANRASAFISAWEQKVIDPIKKAAAHTAENSNERQICTDSISAIRTLINEARDKLQKVKNNELEQTEIKYILDEFSDSLEQQSRLLDTQLVRPVRENVEAALIKIRDGIKTKAERATQSLDTVKKDNDDLGQMVAILRDNIEHITADSYPKRPGGKKGLWTTFREVWKNRGENPDASLDETDALERELRGGGRDTRLRGGTRLEKKTAKKTIGAVESLADLNADMSSRIDETLSGLTDTHSAVERSFEDILDGVADKSIDDIMMELDAVSRTLDEQAPIVKNSTSPISAGDFSARYETTSEKINAATHIANAVMRNTRYISPFPLFDSALIHRISTQRAVGRIARPTRLWNDVVRGDFTFRDWIHDRVTHPLVDKFSYWKPNYRRNIERGWGFIMQETSKRGGGTEPDKLYYSKMMKEIRLGFEANDRDGVIDALLHQACTYGEHAGRDKGIPDSFPERLIEMRERGELPSWMDDEFPDIVAFINKRQVDFANSVRAALAKRQKIRSILAYPLDTFSEVFGRGRTELPVYKILGEIAIDTVTWPVKKPLKVAWEYADDLFGKKIDGREDPVAFESKFLKTLTGLTLMPVFFGLTTAHPVEEGFEWITGYETDLDFGSRAWQLAWYVPTAAAYAVMPGDQGLSLNPFDHNKWTESGFLSLFGDRGDEENERKKAAIKALKEAGHDLDDPKTKLAAEIMAEKGLDPKKPDNIQIAFGEAVAKLTDLTAADAEAETLDDEPQTPTETKPKMSLQPETPAGDATATAGKGAAADKDKKGAAGEGTQGQDQTGRMPVRTSPPEDFNASAAPPAGDGPGEEAPTGDQRRRQQAAANGDGRSLSEGFRDMMDTGANDPATKVTNSVLSGTWNFLASAGRGTKAWWNNLSSGGQSNMIGVGGAFAGALGLGWLFKKIPLIKNIPFVGALATIIGAVVGFVLSRSMAYGAIAGDGAWVPAADQIHPPGSPKPPARGENPAAHLQSHDGGDPELVALASDPENHKFFQSINLMLLPAPENKHKTGDPGQEDITTSLELSKDGESRYVLQIHTDSGQTFLATDIVSPSAVSHIPADKQIRISDGVVQQIPQLRDKTKIQASTHESDGPEKDRFVVHMDGNAHVFRLPRTIEELSQTAGPN